MGRLLLLSLACLSVACSSVGGVVTSSSTLHQARVAVHNGDLTAGMNLYRIVLDESSASSVDAAEARYHIALIRMQADPLLADTFEARAMLDALRASERAGYKLLEVDTLLAALDRFSALDGNVAGVQGQVSTLQAEVLRLQEELAKTKDTLRSVNAAIGGR